MSPNEQPSRRREKFSADNPKPISLLRKEPRPFRLPEYEWAFFRFVEISVNALMRAKNPVLSKINAVPAPAIHISRNTTPEGEVIENKPMLMSLGIAIAFEDVLAGRLTAVAETINDAAEEGLKTLLPKVSEHITRVIDAFGTRVDMKGAPFDHIAVRKVVEASEIEFDEHGVPDFEPWIFTSDGLQRATTFPDIFKQFPPRTPAETEAWRELIQRKRSEFNDKRRSRKLS
jgi:hypothetical protein